MIESESSLYSGFPKGTKHKNTSNSSIPKKLPALYQRYFATLIDYMFVFACAYSVSIYTTVFNEGSAETFIAIIAALFIYDALLTSKLCTVGQLIFGFRVRSHKNLSRIGFALALKRTVIKLVLGIYSLIAILFNRQRRAVHDLITETIAISQKDVQ
ncbi:MAG: RDD family protein [Colwellia sp.]|nr:RDD family protein [Colwellia sp.]